MFRKKRVPAPVSEQALFVFPGRLFFYLLLQYLKHFTVAIFGLHFQQVKTAW